ncbi:MAG: dihydropteroate synthase [Holophagales bacterium]|jgi:dihydropteroate synthase|nr:dihydropteroate synthase [Holophagales bacterium]
MYWKLPRNKVPLESLCYLAILNLTPDSFSDGGLFFDTDSALNHVKKLLDQGAQIIDIGSESTKPGSHPVEPCEEWARIEPVINDLRKEQPDCLLSIDTRHPETARLALDVGADIINDVTGFQDPEMLELVSNSKCGVIAMRVRMINDHIYMPNYSDSSPKDADNAIQELEIVKNRLLNAEIEPERILLDPGFGFGTTFLEDHALWNALHEIPALLNWPVERFCIGISRKRFVARSFGVSGNAMLDMKTAELHKNAVNIGYRVLRTHSIPSIPR